ncbi:MAG TPA: 4-(cytidine 5'-diphospho)-2-C-methyl-D-erythritol kinase [Gemmatimonadales bacterium]|jgi:4-diphosphocytidyl-2-C-methyl-D-erythritol kinase|nr:4-(cytidine 5'-diphospho)-2-C-methyl-D-erythritol kinase [Gemmatimonadales bacterium]
MAVVRIHSPAKVNLFLRILAREEDGFHGIETLFCRIALADELVAERRDGNGVTIDTTGADPGPDDQNLAVRAAHAVIEATGRKFGVHLTLTKRIPVRAGLGGGSSNAAASLLAVNHLANNAVPRHELLQFGGRLGSDVPFCLSGGPMALGWGHGERLVRLPPLPAAPALLLIPPIGVPTVDAYRWVDQARAAGHSRGAVALDLESLTTWGSIGRMAGNEFESVVFGRHPEIRAAFEALTATHPLLCRMSGSGSAIFAVYRTSGERDDAAMMLSPRLGQRIPTETLAHGPTGPEPC